MQTFVPLYSYEDSANVLDRMRLGKQRIEAKSILQILTKTNQHWNNSNAWANHPAVKMWRGFELELAHYGKVICDKWIARGYKDSQRSFFINFILENRWKGEKTYPSWWLSSIHKTHRAALLFKDYEHYSQFGWIEKPIINYYWPNNG